MEASRELEVEAPPRVRSLPIQLSEEKEEEEEDAPMVLLDGPKRKEAAAGFLYLSVGSSSSSDPQAEDEAEPSLATTEVPGG